MKQILQSLKTGQTTIANIPQPQIKKGCVLIQTSQSLISSGTEKMLVEFGKANWLDKARQQPERVGMVIDKIKTDGVLPTIDSIRTKLDQLLAMGYCNVGTVIGVAPDVTEFKIGDRVISNGPHAEIVSVAKNLCCKIPANVSDENAAFTVLGAIALQGIRLAQPALGENFVVIGLGLIGLLAVQLLRAHGCRVLGIDISPEKVALAKQFGAEGITGDVDILASACHFSRERGVDGVLITAASESNELIHQAAQMCRKRGRIILVGVTGLNLSREDFYKKELTFQVSCSYGPGRYDDAYELEGHDYPVGFVRWTEQRNFEAFLDMLASERFNVAPLISHRYSINEAHRAYDLLTGDTESLGILIQYPQEISTTDKIVLRNSTIANQAAVRVAFIGAGNYASRILIPAFKNTAADCKIIACSTGVSATQAAQKYDFEAVTTNTANLITDPAINTVVIASRHDSHAEFVCAALRANKHVFVEKPLCLHRNELEKIQQCLSDCNSLLMIGFNRRFAPHIVKINELLAPLTEPMTFIMTVNAGAIAAEHWTQNKNIGGGRIIGEACHFIDLLRFLAKAKIESYHLTKLNHVNSQDKVSISLNFEDGSFGVIHYLANGHRAFPKERLEIFASGRVLQLDNFRRLRGFGFKHFNKMNLWRQDKGQKECVKQFVNAITTAKASPIPLNEIIEVTKLSIDLAEQA